MFRSPTRISVIAAASLGLLTLLLVSLAQTPSAVAGTSNAVTNGGFEQDLAGWQVSGAVERVTTNPRSGVAAVQLRGESAHVQQGGIAIPASATAVVPSFWYRFDRGDSLGATLRLVILDAASETPLYSSNFIYTEAERTAWTLYSDTFNSASIAQDTRGKTVIVRLILTNSSSPHTVAVIDDVALEVDGGSTPPSTTPTTPALTPTASPPPAGTQMLQNSGFESGTWGAWQAQNAAALDSGVKYTGLWSARLGNSANVGGSIAQPISVPASASTLTLSFVYYISSSETKANSDRICAELRDAGGTAVARYCLDISSARKDGWSTTTISFTTAELAAIRGSQGSLAFVLTTDSALPSQVWIDDTGLWLVEQAGARRVYLPTIIKPSPVQHTVLTSLAVDAHVTGIDFQGNYGVMSGAGYGSGYLWIWTGNGWAALNLPSTISGLYDVSVLPSGEAWVVGGNCNVLHRVGTTWYVETRLMPSDCGATLSSVHAIGSTNVWAISDFLDVVRWNGQSWQRLTDLPGTAVNASKDIAFFSATHGFVVGKENATDGKIWHYENGAWRAETFPGLRQFNSLSLRGTDGWIVGERGVTLRWNGSRWLQQASNVGDDFVDVYIAPDGSIFAATTTNVYQRVGNAWLALPAPPHNVLWSNTDIAADPSGSLWVGGMERVLRYATAGN